MISFKLSSPHCQLRIKSEPFLMDLKFKSEHLEMDDLYPQRNLESGIANFFKHIEESSNPMNLLLSLIEPVNKNNL